MYGLSMSRSSSRIEGIGHEFDFLDTGAPACCTPAWNDLYSKRVGVYGSEHSGGANLAFADSFVSQQISLLTLHNLCTKGSGEVIAEEY
jgi:prepilin-type processing-associated H-X9-DG protein